MYRRCTHRVRVNAVCLIEYVSSAATRGKPGQWIDALVWQTYTRIDPLNAVSSLNSRVSLNSLGEHLPSSASTISTIPSPTTVQDMPLPYSCQNPHDGRVLDEHLHPPTAMSMTGMKTMEHIAPISGSSCSAMELR